MLKTFQVIVSCRCRMSMPVADTEIREWDEEIVVIAPDERKAKKSAYAEIVRIFIQDKDDMENFSVGKMTVSEIKGKDLVGLAVKVRPKFFDSAEYEITAYRNGNYQVTSKMWLKKSDFVIASKTIWNTDKNDGGNENDCVEKNMLW